MMLPYPRTTRGAPVWCLLGMLLAGASAAPLRTNAMRQGISRDGKSGMHVEGGSADGAWPAAAPLPVVLWHGMGDSCCSPYSIGSVKSLIQDKLGELGPCRLAEAVLECSTSQSPPNLRRRHPYMQACMFTALPREMESWKTCSARIMET